MMIEMPTGGELYYQAGSAQYDPAGAEVASAENPDRLSDPDGSLNPRKKVGQILEEPLLINTSLSKEQRREKALSMMAKSA